MWCMCSAPNELHRWHGVWCLGYPGDWQKVARCTEACSDNFAVNISFAWSNSLTLTNKSIFQAHIAICGTGRGEEACFLVRDLLNKTSDQCSVWWRPQSPPVAEWTDSRGRVRVWPSQHYISVQLQPSLDFLPLLPQWSCHVSCPWLRSSPVWICVSRRVIAPGHHILVSGSASKWSIRRFVITEKAPTFTFKTLC